MCKLPGYVHPLPSLHSFANKNVTGHLCGMRSLSCSHQAMGYHTPLPIQAQAGQHRLWREGPLNWADCGAG